MSAGGRDREAGRAGLIRAFAGWGGVCVRGRDGPVGGGSAVDVGQGEARGAGGEVARAVP